MGAWGVDTFHNDTAADWVSGIEASGDLEYVRRTLEAVALIGEDYLDAGLGSEGLAACEVIARLKGSWGVRDTYSESVDLWVERHQQIPPSAMVDLALKVIDRVVRSPSELLELWGESEENAAWLEAVIDLRTRVAA